MCQFKLSSKLLLLLLILVLHVPTARFSVPIAVFVAIVSFKRQEKGAPGTSSLSRPTPQQYRSIHININTIRLLIQIAFLYQ